MVTNSTNINKMNNLSHLKVLNIEKTMANSGQCMGQAQKYGRLMGSQNVILFDVSFFWPVTNLNICLSSFAKDAFSI
jgi:hypothetical protein